MADRCASTDGDNDIELTMEQIVSRHVSLVDCIESDTSALDSAPSKA
jgi:hypothetical protein